MTRYGWLLSLALIPGLAFAKIPDKINLDGVWKIQLSGIRQDSEINLPSTTDMARLGTPLDSASMSDDEKYRRLARRFSYIGPAVYSREVEITPEMAGKPLELTLERVIWKSTAKLGGEAANDTLYSLVSPHRHIFSKGLKAGKHLLEVEIDNSRQYDISTGNLAHSYTNDTQTMWNGILGEISLRAIPEIDVDRIEVHTVANGDSVYIKGIVNNFSSKSSKQKVNFSIAGTPIQTSKKFTLRPGANVVETTLPVSSLQQWNEFNPQLYTASVGISGKSEKDAVFGIRTIDNKDGLRINGIPVFLRGTLECCVFPLTGAPATDKKGWEKTFSTAKEWGLNHFRFHSWCPPEAAFEVADSLGFYLQVELPVWSLKIGDDPQAEQFLKDEYENIIRNYGNHPSFCLLSVGNELQHDFNWLNSMVKEMKQRDPRHLYTTTSFTFEKGHGGHPEPEDEFFVTQWTDNGWVRGQGVFETESPSFNADYSDRIKDFPVPLISHEIGQYAVFPSMDEIGKYTGTLNPLNFKLIRKNLKDKGLYDQSRDMTLASANLAALMYKEEIERALKTKGMSGFQLLGLQDFPGQGTALVGLIDAFWDNKGAVSPEWFRQFCSPVTPLLNYESAIYRNTDVFNGEILLANFSDKAMTGNPIFWEMTDASTGKILASGKLSLGEAKAGEITSVGKFSTPLDMVTDPSAVVVKVKINDDIENSWKIHVYPKTEITNGNVISTRSFDEAQKALAKGKTVLLSPAPDQIEGIESKFLPVFWSPVHFPKQAGTMGIMCDPKHPALQLFPNEGHTDWQWWNPLKNAKVVDIDSISSVAPIISAIDNFVHNRRLAYVFEAKCGKGRLLFSAFDILNPDNDNPAMNQLKVSLMNYVNGDSFNPKSVISFKELESLYKSAGEDHTTSPTSIYE